MIRGASVNLGGEEFVLAPLTFAQLRDGSAKDIATIEDSIAKRAMFSDEYFNAMARVVHASLSRNYPDMTFERVLSLLDLGNARDCYKAVLGLSGLLKEPGAGEQKAAGA